MGRRTRSISWSEYGELMQAGQGKLPPAGFTRLYFRDMGLPGAFDYKDVVEMTPTPMNSGTDVCTDQTNIRLSGGRWSGGGRFSVTHTSENYGSAQVVCKGVPATGLTLWDCDVAVRAKIKSWYLSYHDPNLPVKSAERTENYGAQAWSRYKPGKPNAGLAVFLAEIRDLPRMLRDTNMFLKSIWNKSYHPTPRQLGKDYLTYQFGMAPFMRDIRQFMDLAMNFERRLDSLRRLNGQWIKRSGSVAGKEDVRGQWTSGLGYYGFTWSPHTNTMIPSACGAVGSSTYQERIWFSGRFRYAIPEVELRGKSIWEHRNLARKMAGLSITPAVAWELIPWSWFIDYFLHVGDLLENLDHGVASECAAKYAYLMNTSEMRSEQQNFAGFKHGAGISGVATISTVTKTRSVASPFGFGLTGELNPGQLAILSALGLSRS